MAMADIRLPSLPVVTRRRWLAGAAAGLTGFVLPSRGRTAEKPAPETSADGFRVLRARAGQASLRGPNEAPTSIWGYDGLSPGPTLRVPQGEEIKVRLINELRQSTAVHWHGLRLPNAMDGVPHLTQMAIEPGASFDYRFVPPDAGTFWYHSHFLSSEQLARGLYGVLIVDERQPVEVDRDVALVIADWRLRDDGVIHPSFGNLHDAAMGGRLGQYITLNSEDTLDLPVRANERLRLRLINAANARIFQFRIAEHVARVMAVDGQPCPPNVLADGRVRLGPGNRVDLFLDASLAPGAHAPILVDDLRGGELEVGRLVYDKGAPLRAAPLAEPAPLPNNPLPVHLDLANAFTLEVPLDGGMTMMMGRGMARPEFQGYGISPRERVWALRGIASTGHEGPPLFDVKRGQTVVLTLPNRSVFPHAMHVHGHHFRRLERDGGGWKPYWLDTIVVDPERTERIAFVADNPGKWMIHCHMIEHQETGMAAWFQVT